MPPEQLPPVATRASSVETPLWPLPLPAGTTSLETMLMPLPPVEALPLLLPLVGAGGSMTSGPGSVAARVEAPLLLLLQVVVGN